MEWLDDFKTMKTIIDLIQRAGVEKVPVQYLSQSFHAMDQKKDHARVTFCTEKGKASELARSVFTGKPPEYVGLVVWIPATAWDASSNNAI